MKPLKIVAAVVAYYPDESVEANIGRYLDSVDRVYVWDNTPDRERRRLDIDDSRMVVMGDGSNRGIAYALNRIVREARKLNATHLLTMDQDSRWVDFGRTVAAVETVAERFGRKAVIVPNVNNQFEIVGGGKMTSVCSAITSGMLIPMETFDGVGLSNEFFTVDCVDSDFCIRLQQCGVPIVAVTDSHLEQRFGNHRKGLFGVALLGYSPERYGLILRSHLLLGRLYGHGICRTLWWWFVVRMVKIIVAEDCKAEKTRCLFRGLYEGLTVTLPDCVIVSNEE